MTEHDRLGPPPVEPLSDVAWSRIERGLWSRMDAAPARAPARSPRPRRWMWLAAPALAAAAAVAAVVIGTGGERPQDEVSARLVSGAAPTTLSYGDVHVTLDANSAVVMDHAQGALLERGAAWFAVAPRGERPAFVVTAGDTVVRVIGTRFRVARSGEEATVEVDHGLVEVQFRGATSRVGAGEAWSSQQPTRVVAVRTADASQPGPDPTAQAAPPAPIEIDPEPARPEPARPEPARPAPPAPTAGARPAPAAPGARERPADRAAADLDAARYHRLEQLEVRDPKAAIDGYLELARRSPRWAEPALFAAARLAADRREPRARQLLDIYLTRFPSGANVDDARKLRDHSPDHSAQGAPR